MRSDRDCANREPSFLAGACYSLVAGVGIVAAVLLVGALLDGHGGGLTLGAQAGVVVGLVLALGRAADPVLRWPHRGQ